jgi:hypothetical protein
MLKPGRQSKGAITPGMIREALEAHGSFTFRAYGASMMPVVRHGEAIRIEPLPVEQALPGDILFLVTGDGRYMGHRFLGWSHADGQRLLLTSGDTLPHLDPPHAPEALIGRVAATRRGDRDVLIRRGIRGRIMAVASRLSCSLASPLRDLAHQLPPGLERRMRPVIRYLACGPVFFLGALLRS